ncbi:hypothetical protein RI543_001215 [Arxiozyma heterogenica]|uniref:STAS domain-containing protein n=1 Tax=Arxiozyma heterogenica TaxID=278026 RepID=A0AAN7WM85_9SACH|nr:hypothetical protein RI543_001215 [Kazachstania heterogenica]
MTHNQFIGRRKRQSIASIPHSISVSLGLQEPLNNSFALGSTAGGDSGIGGNNGNSNSIPASNNQYNPLQTNYFGRSYVSGLLSNSPAFRRLSRNDFNFASNNSYLPLNNPNNYIRPIHQSQKLHRQTAEISEDLSESYHDYNNNNNINNNNTKNKDNNNNNTNDYNNYKIDEYIDLVETNKRRTAAIDNVDIIDTFIGNNMDGLDTNINDITTNATIGLEDTPQPYLTPISSTVSGNESITTQLLVPTESYRSYGSHIQSHHNIDIETGSSILETNLSPYQKLSSLSYDIINYLPACTLGLLLTILDALSYGMIIFPITEPLFSQLGATGISMFYISTIICQTILSGGWSSFPCGIGSEMIEITPFFHTMAFTIMNTLGQDKPEEVITTTIFCYVISAMITGLTFLLLGKLKLGKIVGFFPRHILIGCIGGVGYFLLITGIEVCTRAKKFEYSIPFLSDLFMDTETLWKWLLPTILTIILILTQNHFQNSLVLPSFYILTLLLFHFIVALIPSLSLTQLRNSGWIFPMAAADSKWYDHYKYFNFKNVHWLLVLKQVPTMLALTFFGILHVPINVPALAMSLQMDKYDVDRELIAHGWSNLISGLCGSIQNYLVYTNSVLFIRAGADSALAGYVLIVFTIIVMLIGPVIISLIPICIVGSLIFLLGYELLVEALIDTWGKLTTFEYLTVIIIVLTMGIFDFVLGIIIGILIACFKFLIDSSKLQTINGEFNGTVAKSTVYRDPIQTKFLNGIGEQIYVLKLQNLLFFGTIISIEEKVDKLLEISDKDSSKRRIKYLILDFKNINADNIDYSAAEGFNRIKRFTQTKKIQLIISSIRERDHIYNAFNNVGLLDDVELFNDLNSALEWCENEFLYRYKEIRDKAKRRLIKLNNSNIVNNRDNSVTHKTFENSSGANNNRLSTIQSSDSNNPTVVVTDHTNNPNDISDTGKGNSTIAKYGTAIIKKNIGQNGINTKYSFMSMPINTPRNHQIFSVAQNIFKTDEQTAKTIRNQLKSEDPIVPLLLLALKPYRSRIASPEKKIRDQEISLWSRLSPYFKKGVIENGSILQHDNNIFFVVETGVLKALFNLPQGTVYETMSNKTCYGKMMIQFNNVLDTTENKSEANKGNLIIKAETDAVLWVIDKESLQTMREKEPDLFIELTLLVMSIKDKRFKDLLGHALVSS